MRNYLLTTGAVTFGLFCSAQSLQRSSINCIGHSGGDQSITIQQTVGQPYQTNSYYSNEIESRPGFIQPSQLFVEMIRSNFEVEVTVYPNPTSSIVYFKFNQNLENIEITVIDQYGKVVFKDKVNSLQNYTLECGEWQSGNYFINLTDQSGLSYNSKLIKQ